MDSIPQASYLLQVWGGFSLVVLFLMLFGINCWVYVKTKIHYTFIFEFDTKHHLDHRQYMEVSSRLIDMTEISVACVVGTFGKFIFLVDF